MNRNEKVALNKRTAEILERNRRELKEECQVPDKKEKKYFFIGNVIYKLCGEFYPDSAFWFCLRLAGYGTMICFVGALLLVLAEPLNPESVNYVPIEQLMQNPLSHYFLTGSLILGLAFFISGIILSFFGLLTAQFFDGMTWWAMRKNAEEYYVQQNKN